MRGLVGEQGVGDQSPLLLCDSLNKNSTIHHLMTQPGFGVAPLRTPGSMTQQLRGPCTGKIALVHVSGDCGENGLFPALNPKAERLLLWSETHTASVS